jgi:transcriptional regulator with XRE-family HTH domain
MGARVQHTFPYRSLCRLLRQWRVDAGLTQRALAARLGKVHSFIFKVEAGERRIDPVEFVSWVRACGVDLADAIKALAAVVPPLAGEPKGRQGRRLPDHRREEC